MLSPFTASLSPPERRCVLAIIALHILFISLPYLWTLLVTPDGFAYGGLLYNPDDQNVHLSWARQAAEGHFFFRDLFTSESLISGERPLFTNLLCWLIGVLSALTTIPIIWVYHLLRVFFAAATLALFHGLSTRLTPDRRIRIVALALVAFSGGGGFLAPTLAPILNGRNWMDRADNAGFPMMPEAFTFLSASIFTLNIASMALLLATYFCCVRAWETGAKKFAVGASVSTLLLANIHTYDVFPLLLAITAWAIFQFKTAREESTEDRSTPHRRFWFLPFVYIGAAIPVLYQLVVFRGSEEFRIKALTRTPAPPLLDVLISYGPLLALAIAGGVLALRAKDKFQAQTLLPILWAIATLLLIYAPVSFARKMIEGLHLPLCFLAAIGIVALVSKLNSQVLRRVAAAGVLGVLSLSSYNYLVWSLENARDNNNARAGVLMPPLYLTTADSGALQFLETLPRGKIVLSLPFIGNYIPRESGQNAFIGHWAETLHFKQKIGPVFNFYSGKMNEEQARLWLKENRIDYVFFGSYEKQLNGKLPLELPVAHADGADENGTTIYAAPF